MNVPKLTLVKFSYGHSKAYRSRQKQKSPLNIHLNLPSELEPAVYYKSFVIDHNEKEIDNDGAAAGEFEQLQWDILLDADAEADADADEDANFDAQ